MKKWTSTLHFGDVVGLTDLEKSGFLVGELDDFDADKLCFERIVRQDVPEHTLTPHNARYAQFVITPKCHYSSHKKINALLQQVVSPGIDLLESKRAQLQHLRKGLPTRDPLRHYLNEVYDAYEKEEKTNDKEFQRSLGHPVMYGATIQLKHLRTGKFVTQSPKLTKGDAMLLSLAADGSKGSWLQIRPADRLRNEHHVRIGDQINLGAVKYPGTFMTFMTAFEEKKGMMTPDAMPPIKEAVDKGPQGSRHEVLFSGADEDKTGKAPASPKKSHRRVGKLEIKVDLEDDSPVCPALQRLEVNASSNPCDMRVQIFRTWKTHAQWLEQRLQDKEENSEERKLPVHGFDVFIIRHGSDRVLYANHANNEHVWWMLASDDTAKQDEDVFLANTLWRLKPVQVSHACEPYNYSSHAAVYFQHVVSGKYLGVSQGKHLGDSKENRVVLVEFPADTDVADVSQTAQASDKDRTAHILPFIMHPPHNAQGVMMGRDSVWIQAEADHFDNKGVKHWLGLTKKIGMIDTGIDAPGVTGALPVHRGLRKFQNIFRGKLTGASRTPVKDSDCVNSLVEISEKLFWPAIIKTGAVRDVFDRLEIGSVFHLCFVTCVGVGVRGWVGGWVGGCGRTHERAALVCVCV